jgi:hypothetical protein
MTDHVSVLEDINLIRERLERHPKRADADALLETYHWRILALIREEKCPWVQSRLIDEEQEKLRDGLKALVD